MASAHDILGVAPGASPAQVKAAYRRLAKRAHPDSAEGSAARFAEVRTAYEQLAAAQAPQRLRSTVTTLPPSRRFSLAPLARGLLGLGVAAAGVGCWWLGDGEGRNNGWFVAIGWLLVLTGWRIFAERKARWRHPALSMLSGVGHAAAGLVGFAATVFGLGVMLFTALGVMSVLEHVGLVH